MLKRKVNLVSCDTEPIHEIGAIQPYGALVALQQDTLRIEHASANAAAYFGREASDILGRPARDLLGDANCAALLALDLEPRSPELLKPWFVRLTLPDGSQSDLECYANRHAGRIVLEFVHREDGPAQVWEEDLLRQKIISELIRPASLAELAGASSRIIREVTGFDRVMIYRFAPDKHGEVIAESTVRPDSYLGLHYPASDIPDPARRHFVLNVIRTIPDINAVPVPILTRDFQVADADSALPLDLTYSKLRAVAPVHIEYLNNMGVGASMSISLTANDELWGLVACHHYGPIHLSWSRLRFCELLGSTISALLQSHANTLKLNQSIRAEKLAFEIEREARGGKPLMTALEHHASDIMQQTGASGLFIRLGVEEASRGIVPEPIPDFALLEQGFTEGLAVSDHLDGLFPRSNRDWNEAAGVALFELSDDGSDVLALFRAEFAETIAWAGKPEKVETRGEDGTVRLSPRGSFALWSEERKGRSMPFTDSDMEVLRILRRAFFALNSLDRERAAVAARAQAEAEEARLKLILLDAARDRSMGELAAALAHELNQPLSAVTNYVNASRQELRNYNIVLPPSVGGLMESAVAESSRAADLVRRLRNFIAQGEVVAETIDLHAVIRQAVELAFVASREETPAVAFSFDPKLIRAHADPVQMGQVILNLVRNSLSALANVEEPLLTIATRLHTGRIEVSVRDNGPGIPPESEKLVFEPFHSSTTRGMGIGLSLCRSIVEAHGGRIWSVSGKGGAEIVFSLPHEDTADAPSH